MINKDLMELFRKNIGKNIRWWKYEMTYFLEQIDIY